MRCDARSTSGTSTIRNDEILPRHSKCARIGKNDRPAIDPFSIQDAEVLIAAIHQDWGEAQGNYDELRLFTGLRLSEAIALVISDYDAEHGVLNVTQARVVGIDQDVTKTGEDRRIALCPRAITMIERQLRLRQRLADLVSCPADS